MDPEAVPTLFDILRCLPLDVVEDQVWKLLDSDNAKNFRLTCVSARELSEVLTTSANFLFKTSPTDGRRGPLSVGVAASDAADQESVLASRRAALLGRLSRQRALKIPQCDGRLVSRGARGRGHPRPPHHRAAPQLLLRDCHPCRSSAQRVLPAAGRARAVQDQRGGVSAPGHRGVPRGMPRPPLGQCTSA